MTSAFNLGRMRARAKFATVDKLPRYARVTPHAPNPDRIQADNGRRLMRRRYARDGSGNADAVRTAWGSIRANKFVDKDFEPGEFGFTFW